MRPLQFVSSQDVLKALRLWHGRENAKWPLAQMRLSAEVRDEQIRHSSLADAGMAAQNRAILNRGLQALHIIAPESEELLRERFEERRDVLDMANSLNLSESGLYHRQRQAIAQLTEILNKLENEASSDWQERVLSRLPLPSYTELVGIYETRQRLFDVLLNREAHFIVAIEGLGGLGKTALADRTTRDLTKMTHFDEIAWVTAKQTHLSSLGRLQIESNRPALTFPMLIDQLAAQFGLSQSEAESHLQRQRLVKQYLQEQHCLVVVDNLETVADYRTLLPELRKWQRPSKFVITSRLRLLDEPGIFSLVMKELSMAAAFELIRLEAQRTGFTTLATAEEEELQQIYNVVGGNPLALKLITGQLRFQSLDRVLDRFGAGRKAESQEGLFDYIYQEIWENLQDEGKTTLLALTQAGESGFTFEHLTAVSGLDEQSISTALEKLVLLSLVDLGGNLNERRYRLHRLTEVFLLRMFN
ncbi:MAG: NB-ARC domain-containing protein [Chloroflexota bacterium]